MRQRIPSLDDADEDERAAEAEGALRDMMFTVHTQDQLEVSDLEIPSKGKSSQSLMCIVTIAVTPLQKRMQVQFWLPIKIPAEYVGMMPGLPENAKSKIFHGRTLSNKFREKCFQGRGIH